MARLDIEIAGNSSKLLSAISEGKRALEDFNSIASKIKPINFGGSAKGGSGLDAVRAEAIKLSATIKDSLAESYNHARKETEWAKQATEQYKQTLLSTKNAIDQHKIATEAQRTALNKTKADMAELALSTRRNKTETDVAVGSYREAQIKLTALGFAIRNAKGGFDATTPAVRAQITAYNELNNKLKQFDATMGNHQRNVGNYPQTLRSIGSALTSSLAPALLAVRAVAGIGSALGQNIGISDSISDIRRTSEQSQAEVISLTEALKNLPSRTPLKDLLDISIIAGQLGIAKDQTEGFVKSLDYLGVALAKEIPGGAQVIAESLGKVNGVFKIATQEGITAGQAMEKTGSSILALGQAGLATGGFLVDFAQRVGGASSIAKIALPTMLAYGATLEEAGVSAEVAGTAVSKLIGELAKKREDFFAIAQLGDAKLTLQEFTNLINTDAEAALDKFFKGLNNGGTSLTSFYDILAGAGIKSERYTNAILALANNQERLTELTSLGTKEFNKGTLAAEQAALRNTNLAGVLERVGNNLKNAFINPAVSQSLADFIAKTTGLSSSSDILYRKTSELIGELNSQDSQVTKLTGRYSELIGNTNKTTSENVELSDIVKKIGELLPDAVTKWNEYGDALEINASKANELSSSYRQLVKDLNLSNATKGLEEFNDIQERIAKNERKLRFARQEKKYQPSLLQKDLVQREDINPIIQAIAEDNKRLLDIAKRTQDSGNELSKAQRDLLIAFGQDKASEAMYRFDMLPKSIGKSTQAVTALEQRNKEFWEKEVKRLSDIRDSINSNEIGTKKWTKATSELSVAQKNLDLYSDKKTKSTGNKSDANKAIRDQKELDKISREITQSNLSTYEAELDKVLQKYEEIRSKVKNPDLLKLAEQNAIAEILKANIKQIGDFIDKLKKSKPLQLLTDTTVKIPDVSNRIDRDTRNFNNRVNTSTYGKALMKEDDKLENRLSKVVESGFRKGITNILGSITELGSNFREVFTNVFQNLAGSVNDIFKDLFATKLGNLLKSSFDDIDIAGLGNKVSQGIIAGAGIAGGLISGVTKKTSYAGQGIGGAITGASAGLALGPIGAIAGGLIGGIAGIFSAKSARKQEETQRKQLEEQKKQTLLQERIASLTYASNIIGQRTSQGIVTGVDRNALGELTFRIDGRDLVATYKNETEAQKRGL